MEETKETKETYNKIVSNYERCSIYKFIFIQSK